MKLLFLLLFVVLTSENEALVTEKTTENNDVTSHSSSITVLQPSAQNIIKKVEKRSYSWPPLHIGAYTPIFPWYRLGGLSSYRLYDYGWYPSWPLLSGSLYGDWYRGW